MTSGDEAKIVLDRLLLGQRLRDGAAPLLRDLRANGHDVWLYTTSYRNPTRLWLGFRCLGIRLGGIVHQRRHEREVARDLGAPGKCSKYPPTFGIDLLVDDSLGVEMEGREHGFAVCRVDPADPNWTQAVHCAVGLASHDTAEGSP
jgi:hypothetical protein